jgi:hypothetical protein
MFDNSDGQNEFIAKKIEQETIIMNYEKYNTIKSYANGENN